jgi:excisionase family DNA binding protein
MAEEFYTTEELARMLKCHVLTVRRRIYAGELKAFKDKRRWLVSREEFERYQEERSRPEPPTPEGEPEAPILSELKPNQIACLFSPGGGIRQVIRDELDRAQEEIVLAIYDLTMRTLCRALERAHQRGVKVRILFDRTQVEGRFSKYRYLQKRGIDCRIERLEGVFHHKFCVIDRCRVLTGSYNWTASAEFRNQENLVWISEPGVAEGFSRKFEELWEASGAD